ncbi:hypothetical protein PILCRDRAFT_9935 [Piloderma croceum F 1598]|uniref:Uncharacterized protein n=1 Tax=Piloderma croceum (strain F 1598) TaxID=765440 RepID=A0A0C3FJK7_PILCF|nr:hypothetical protein PILCRDRAFT_9935 [Piloderma croceum F 1598]
MRLPVDSVMYPVCPLNVFAATLIAADQASRDLPVHRMLYVPEVFMLARSLTRLPVDSVSPLPIHSPLVCFAR